MLPEIVRCFSFKDVLYVVLMISLKLGENEANEATNPHSKTFLTLVRVSSSFWKHVLSWLRDYNISIDNLKEEDVIFGKFDIAEDFLLFNHILLLGKFYIYSRKYQNGIPSLQGFIARTRRIYNIELHIAGKETN